MNGPNLLMVGSGLPVPALGEFLSILLATPIVNQTGILEAARFNYVFEFLPDDSLAREFRDQVAAWPGDMQIASDPSAIPRASGLVTALEEQLGLRLERIRAPREFIVIDRVERPAPN